MRGGARPARDLVAALGGATNLVDVRVDFTRVSIWLAEPGLVDEDSLGRTGIVALLFPSARVQLKTGAGSERLVRAIREEIVLCRAGDAATEREVSTGATTGGRGRPGDAADARPA